VWQAHRAAWPPCSDRRSGPADLARPQGVNPFRIALCGNYWPFVTAVVLSDFVLRMAESVAVIEPLGGGALASGPVWEAGPSRRLYPVSDGLYLSSLARKGRWNLPAGSG